MRLRGVRGSQNVEDRRAQQGGGGGARIGGVGLLLVLAIGYFAGVDVTPLLQGGMDTGAPRQISAEEEKAAEFSSRVLATTEELWTQVFSQQVGRAYEPPVMVLYSGVARAVRRGRFTALRMKRPISTRISSRRFRSNWARGAISRRLM